MAACAPANPHPYAEETHFYGNKEKAQRKKKDEEIDLIISKQVDRDFKKMGRNDMFNTSEDEEEAGSSIMYALINDSDDI